MPAAKYEAIYRQLREAIRQGGYRRILPSEHQLTEEYACARNTIRRAIARLAEEGYVQSVHGKGVVILHQEREPAQFMISDIESMKEAAERNHLQVTTKVIHFAEVAIDAPLSEITGFPEGEAAYYIQRLRCLEGEALILDHNYFLCRIVRNLSAKIAEGSIYEYMENVLKETIVTTQRKYTVERTAELDEQWMDLHGCNCLAVISSRTYNKDGIQFEYTQSRHRPDRFVFYGQVRRRKGSDIGID